MQKLKGKPFALIGVSTNAHPPLKLKEVMEKEKLNWRSFDERSGIIAGWNNPSTPGYYLLDHHGVIRYKWSGYPGERALDAALEKLIREADRNGSDTKERRPQSDRNGRASRRSRPGMDGWRTPAIHAGTLTAGERVNPGELTAGILCTIAQATLPCLSDRAIRARQTSRGGAEGAAAIRGAWASCSSLKDGW